jgi:hypothetical protein
MTLIGFERVLTLTAAAVRGSMPTIVVGGHSRKVGKTAVTAGLIHAFRELPWTALKISTHGHSEIPMPQNGRKDDSFRIYEETDRSATSDSSRFLAAGACRSFWMQTRGDLADDSLAEILPVLQSNPFVMIESNRILRLIRPDLFIMVLRYDVADFKESARRVLGQANAVVAVNPDPVPMPWPGVSQMLSGIQQFVTADPQVVPAGLIDFVRLRLQIK